MSYDVNMERGEEEMEMQQMGDQEVVGEESGVQDMPFTDNLDGTDETPDVVVVKQGYQGDQQLSFDDRPTTSRGTSSVRVSQRDQELGTIEDRIQDALGKTVDLVKDGSSADVIDLRQNLKIVGKTGNIRYKGEIVIKKVEGEWKLNTWVKSTEKAVKEFTRLIGRIEGGQEYTNRLEVNGLLVNSTPEAPPIDGLTKKENRDYLGCMNPPLGIPLEPRVRPNGFLERQVLDFIARIDLLKEQSDSLQDEDSIFEINERIVALETAKENIIERRELERKWYKQGERTTTRELEESDPSLQPEKTRAAQGEDITRLEDLKEWIKENSKEGTKGGFKEWAKRNMVGLSALAIGIAGIITTIIIAGRKAVLTGAQGVSKFAKAVAKLGKKLWPLLAPIFSIISQILSLGARGLAFLSRNLWVLAIAFAWFVYDQYKERRRK